MHRNHNKKWLKTTILHLTSVLNRCIPHPHLPYSLYILSICVYPFQSIIAEYPPDRDRDRFEFAYRIHRYFTQSCAAKGTDSSQGLNDRATSAVASLIPHYWIIIWFRWKRLVVYSVTNGICRDL